MPIYEYQAEQCLGPKDCPQRFAFRQTMNEPPVTRCRVCGTAMTRILSSFSAGAGTFACEAAEAGPAHGSCAPPATLKNMFGGGLRIVGCGHAHGRDCGPKDAKEAESRALR
ncbi:MAG: zinc ribbon domain-containing protein [Nitrospirota bacterium]